jgi:hypothetical protein
MITDLRVRDKMAEKNAQTFVEAGFTVERHDDDTVVYSRPVSEDVREAARVLVHKRQIGFKSKDILPRSKRRR